MNIDKYLQAMKPNPIHDEIYELAVFASETYERLRRKAGLSNKDGDHWDIDRIQSFEKNGIVTEWEYSWNYGGSSNGEAFIPINAIIGSESERLSFIESVVRLDVSERDEHNLLNERINKSKRQSEYEKLKLEFDK